MMVPLEQLKSLLGETNADPAGGNDRQTASALYECSACDRVYISRDMGSCPECGSALGHVPNEQDLGLDR